mmetsp:Transcript_39292/g.77793  ORF Transcript_39292/g.77793 Transcript_39292/m.77793 type:complete len:81 (+) Transcript_39292:108-350(+)
MVQQADGLPIVFVRQHLLHRLASVSRKVKYKSASLHAPKDDLKRLRASVAAFKSLAALTRLKMTWQFMLVQLSPACPAAS